MLKRRIMSLILSAVMVLSLIPANIVTHEVEVQAASANRVVGYFPSYRTYAMGSIDYSAMTHCILAFMTYNNGTLTSGFNASDVQTIVSNCHNNGAKCMIAIGGWGGFVTSDDPFGTAAERTAFVDQVMNYVTTYNLDGVDIDIELADAYVWTNFDAAMSELASRLHAQGKLLTMAVAPWFTGNIANSTYNHFDFLNLMTYDYNQAGTGEVAPWSQIYDNISYYSSRGVSNDRMTIGVPFYGYSTSGAVTYAEMVNQNAAYAYQDYANGVYYNGINTIKEKAEYSKQYGGTMIWEIAQDSFGQYSLLQAIKEVMATGETATDAPTEAPTTQSSSTTGGPEEVFGQIISSTTPGIIDVVWGAASNGQTYNVYVDGSIATSSTGAALSNVGCAAYQIPASAGTHTVKITAVLNGQESAGVTATVTVTGSSTEVTTTTAAVSDGYTTAGANWNDLNYWSVYFASGWAGDPTGGYKDGNSYNDFSVKINTASNADWGVQLKTQAMSVEAGAEYVCKVNVTTNMGSTTNVRFKDDISGTEILQPLVAGSNTFELNFTAGSSAQIFFDLGQAPAGLEFTITSFSLEKVEEETTTEAPTTEAPTEEPTTVINTNAKVEINGCQVSTTTEGYRIVYSMSDVDSEVAEVGMVYGLADYATESEMVAGSTNSYVYSYTATEAGKLSKSYSSMSDAQSYAMTMSFVKTAEFFNQKIYVRAYAKLKTGEYIYSDVKPYVMYDVADYLYQNQKMSNMAGHDYLYNEILSVVNPSYQAIEFDLDNILAKF